MESKNQKMSENYRLMFNNFVKIYNRILTQKKRLICNKPLTQSNIQALQNDLTDLKPLIERTWLEEKVRELMAALE